jgi:flagellar biosynthesis/type III secretory pathway protein FliH
LSQPLRGVDIEALLEEWWQDRTRAEADPKFGPYFRITHERVLEACGVYAYSQTDLDEAEREGYTRGYEAAKDDLQDEYDKGWNDGHQKGYDEGYADGVQSEQNRVEEMLSVR